MVVRSCVQCAASVTTEFCPRCGARQPGWDPAAGNAATDNADTDNADYPDTDNADTTTMRMDFPTTSLPTDPRPRDPRSPSVPVPAEGEQPWHPFEQPSWYSGVPDPGEDASRSRRAWAPGNPTELGPDFMGVSQWQTEPPETPADRNRSWMLGSLAGVAVVLLLGVIAFLVIRGQSSQSATPDPATIAAVTSTTSTPDTVASGAPAPVVTVTATETADASTAASETAASETAASETAATSEPPASEPSVTAVTDPMGGPVRDIACAAGYIVQIASGVDEASFTARVAELTAAGQLPPDAAVARTGSSCAIFAGQTNSIVLYVGPFADPYAGCAARLGGAPDSFIKGTTPETARDYVSCLCPTQVTTIPTFTGIGQTGIWVGELQRTLANRLNLAIPDLSDNWGTFTQSTSDAVVRFQTANGLQASGQVGTDTWQALQTAAC